MDPRSSFDPRLVLPPVAMDGRSVSRQVLSPLPAPPVARKGSRRRAAATALFAAGALAAGVGGWGAWGLYGSDLTYDFEQRTLREELALEASQVPLAVAAETKTSSPPSEDPTAAANIEQSDGVVIVAAKPSGGTQKAARTATPESEKRSTWPEEETAAAPEQQLSTSLPGGSQASSGGQPPSDSHDQGLREGKPVGTIKIPAIGVDSVLVWGVSLDALSKGPGVMPQRSKPGEHGNAVISGHRNIHGGVFYKLDKLGYGDRIIVRMGGSEHTYEVRGTTIVDPDDVSVVRQTRGVRLTLTTCTPIGTDKQRLIIQAELVDGDLKDFALPRDQWRMAR